MRGVPREKCRTVAALFKTLWPKLAHAVLSFGDVPLEILNHLRAKLFRDLLSRDGTSPLWADLGIHFHVHTTKRRGIH